MDDIISAIGGFIANNFTALATLALATGTYFTIYLAYFVKPKLKIEFEQKEPFCRFAFIPGELTYLTKNFGEKWIKELKEYLYKSGVKFDPKNLPIPGYWVRIKVRNTGHKSAHHCVGKLVEIKDSDGRVRTDFDISALHWVGHFETDNYYRVFSETGVNYSVHKSNKFEPIDLGIDDHQYLDILWTEFEIDFFHINCPRYPDRGIKYDYEPQIYFLKILVTADNAESAEINLMVEWYGVWDQIKITEIDC
jgi:hypothetical protein